MGKNNHKHRIEELKRRIRKCELYKEQLRENINAIKTDYLLNKISYKEYKRRKTDYLNGRTEEEWFCYYNKIIQEAKQEIRRIRNAERLKKRTAALIPIILITIAVIFMIKPEITGFIVYNQTNTSNITNITNTNNTVPNKTVENYTNITVVTLENQTALNTTNLSNKTITTVNISTNTTKNITEEIIQNTTNYTNPSNVSQNISVNITNLTVSNLTANLSNITNITLNISENLTNITQNLTNLTLNITNITINITNITQNITTNITNVSQNISANISVNITNLTANLSNITNITLNITNITTNLTINITNITVNITGNISNITNLTLNITNITKPNTPPELVKEIQDFTIKNNETLTINLSEYFIDEDNDTLIFTAIKPENITIQILGATAIIKPDNITGIRKLVFIASDLKNITYSNEVTVRIIPSQINRIPKCYYIRIQAIVLENTTINLSKYCYDEDNDNILYKVEQAQNTIIKQNNSIVSVTPLKQGMTEIFFIVNDTKNATTYKIILNVTEAGINETLEQLPAEIGKPVVWIKRLRIKSAKNTTITTNIPREAFNISVEKEEILREANKVVLRKTRIPDNRILLKTEGITRTLLEQKIRTKEIVETNKTLHITGMAVLTTKQGINLELIVRKLLNFFITILNTLKKTLSITGLATLSQPENSTLIFTAEPTNYTITFLTPAPELLNETTLTTQTKWKKIITITSKLHYTNITTYTNITESEPERIHLYEITNNTRVEITNSLEYNIEMLDTNNNTLIDRIRWRIPHLSNKSYEVEVDIVILNVQSYPTVGGNWTVGFNTTGTSDLKITAVNGTTYSEQGIDDNTTTNDLMFLELKCNTTILNNNLFIITNDSRATCMNNTLHYNNTTTNITCEYYTNNITNTTNALLVNYTELKQNNISITTTSIYYKNYGCDNKISYHTVKVLTPGVHNQEFNFGGVIKQAHNLAGAPTITLESPVNNTIIHTGTILNFTITDDNLNQTWWSKDNGQTNTTFYEPWDINTSDWSEGEYDVIVWASDNDTNVKKEIYHFTLNNSVFGNVTIELIWPPDFANTTVYRYDTFKFRARITCSGGPCGDINATLDPITLRRRIEQELIRRKYERKI